MKALRAKLKDSLKEQGIKLTYNHILMKVVAKALMEFPDVNASFADNMLTRHKHVNMGLAVAKGDGLIVPNVKNAKAEVQKSFPQEEELAAKTARLNELNALLNLDKKENEIVDGERGEEEPQKATIDRER